MTSVGRVVTVRFGDATLWNFSLKKSSKMSVFRILYHFPAAAQARYQSRLFQKSSNLGRNDGIVEKIQFH